MQTKVFRGVETTTYANEQGALVGVYRGTAVCTKLEPSGKVILRTGGWYSNTTRNRMNQFAASYCSNRFGVIQRGGKWFVVYWNAGTWDEANKIPFVEEMEV